MTGTRPYPFASDAENALPKSLANLIGAAFRGNLEEVELALKDGADVNAPDPSTGLSALHIAIGNNDIALCRLLIENHGAAFGPDRFGRWPSVVAVECRVDDELADYVLAKEDEYNLRTQG